MSRIGRVVTDPKIGAYCQITLDSGEKILVTHTTDGPQGEVMIIEEVKWWGLKSGDTIVKCTLNNEEGKAFLSRLMTGASEGSIRATPLGAFVDYVKGCRSIAEVKAKLTAMA